MRVMIRSSYINYPLTAVNKQMMKIMQHIEIKTKYVMSPEVNASQLIRYSIDSDLLT